MRYVEFRLISSQWVASAEHEAKSRRKVMEKIRKDAKANETRWSGVIKVRQDNETQIAG